MKVFLVWNNESIDLSVVYGIFSTREQAEECARKEYLADVIEMELDRPIHIT